MKIVFLSTFFPFRGGIAQFNAQMYRAFEKVAIVKAFTFTRQYPDFLFPGETQYVTEEDTADAIQTERTLDTINPISYLKTAKKIKAEKPDLILTKYWMTFFAPSVGFVLSRFRKKAIRICVLDNITPHEKRFFDGFCNRYFLKHNDGFVAMSDTVLADLLQFRPDAKYLRLDHPVYNHFGESVNREIAHQKLGTDPTKKTLLFFGIIRDYKGLDILIDVFSKLDSSYQLIIAGEAYGDFEKYQAKIDQSPSKANIHVFNHYISDDEVTYYFSASDVCMMTYRSATQSGISGIAQHFELPMIATNVGGLKTAVIHEKTGYLVDSIEAEVLAKETQRFFESDSNALFRAELRKMKAENSWERFSEKIIEFYETIRLSSN